MFDTIAVKTELPDGAFIRRRFGPGISARLCGSSGSHRRATWGQNPIKHLIYDWNCGSKALSGPSR
jgi:hypothetical protein